MPYGLRTTAAKDANNHNGELIAYNEFHEAFKPLYALALIAIAALEEKASRLMAEIAAA